jgi:hypothetical protein
MRKRPKKVVVYEKYGHFFMVYEILTELDILNNEIKRLLPPVFSGAPLEHAYQVPFDHLPQFIGVY